MKAQLEQKYNAHYLASKGVEVMPSFELDQARALGHWLQTGRSIQIIQADERERITSDILDLLSSRSGQLNTPLTLVNET